MVNAVKFLVGAGTLIAGFGLAPLSAGAADEQPLQGNVSTSTIDISVSPRALLNVPTGLLGALPAAAALNGPLDKLTIKLDTSSATGTLTGDRNDLAIAHAASNVVDVNVKGIDEILSILTGAIGNLSNVASSVSGLVPSLNQVIGGLVQPLNGVLGQIGPGSLNRSAVADLQPGGTGVTNGSNVVSNLSLPGGLNATLAPFAATATNAATKLSGISGPQAEAHSTTENLNIGPSLPALPGVQGLIDQVNGLIAQLNPVVDQVDHVVGTTLGPAASGIAATLPPAIGGILQTPVAQLSSATPLAPVRATLDQTLATLKGLLPQLNGLLNLGTLELNKLVATDGVTTSSLLRPDGNGAVLGQATSAFADVKLLQLVGDQLSGLLGTGAGMPLLEVTGAQSSASASVNGTDTAAPTGSSKLGTIKVLGRPVLDLGSVVALGTTQTIPVDLGVFALTLQVTTGVPVIANSSATHKSVQVGALEVSLLNGRPDGSGQIPLLGGGGVALASTGALSHARLAATGSNAIVRASFATSAVDVAAGPLNATTASSPQPQGELPKTGRFGPLTLVLGAMLLAGGLALRFIPGAAGRLRRR